MEKELPELKIDMLGRFSMFYGDQAISFKRNTATKALKLLQILLHEPSVEKIRRESPGQNCWRTCLGEKNFPMWRII